MTMATASPVTSCSPHRTAMPKPCRPLFWTRRTSGFLAEHARTRRAVASVLPSSTRTISKGMSAARRVCTKADKVSSTAPSSSRAGMTTESFTLAPPQAGHLLPGILLHQLAEDAGQVVLQLPVGEMRPDFGQIGNIADMVANPVLIIVGVVQFNSHVLQHVNRFEDGDAVLSAPPKVIDLPTPGRPAEVQKQLHHIAGMDLVAHLLALVAKDRIRPPSDRAHHDVGKIALQLDSGVLRT